MLKIKVWYKNVNGESEYRELRNLKPRSYMCGWKFSKLLDLSFNACIVDGIGGNWLCRKADYELYIMPQSNIVLLHMINVQWSNYRIDEQEIHSKSWVITFVFHNNPTKQMICPQNE